MIGRNHSLVVNLAQMGCPQVRSSNVVTCNVIQMWETYGSPIGPLPAQLLR